MTVIKARLADMPKPDSASRAAALAAPPGGQCLVLFKIEELDAPADPKRRFAPIMATADPAGKNTLSSEIVLIGNTETFNSDKRQRNKLWRIWRAFYYYVNS